MKVSIPSERGFQLASSSAGYHSDVFGMMDLAG